MCFQWISNQNQWFSIDFLVRTLLQEYPAADTVTAGQVRPAEVLRRETAEEEFRLRRNQPSNMAPSASKDRYCQADFFSQLFQNNSIFWVPANALQVANSSYFRDPSWDPSNLDEAVRNEAGAQKLRGFDAFCRTHTQTSHRRAQDI